MTILVAVPIYRVSAKVILEKGRGWSAVDEVVLWLLNSAPQPAASLSRAIDLPPRVVLAIISRMMRFRLVEVALLDGAACFQVTEYGRGVVTSGGEIPTAKRRLPRKVAFVVDRITGTVFPRREIRDEDLRSLGILSEGGADIRRIDVKGTPLVTDTAENAARFQEVLNEDETFLHFDGDTLIEREDEYMLVTVEGKDVRGLPPKAPPALLSEVLRAARLKRSELPIVVNSQIADVPKEQEQAKVSIAFDRSDLLFGDKEHLDAFLLALARVKRRVYIHSTFLRKSGFGAFRNEFRQAVRRGARIDIIWGAGSIFEPSEKTLTHAIAIAREVDEDDVLRGGVNVHLATTGSHAKLLISDDGGDGWTAIVGSCNWLYTGFNRFELSMRLRDPQATAQAVLSLAKLVSVPGFRPELGGELYQLSQALKNRTSPAGGHTVSLVTGQSHEAILRHASGQNSHRFIVGSDHLGNSAYQNAIIPAEVFAAAGSATPVVIYGEPSGAVTGEKASEITIDAVERGVRLLRISEGFHAKFLAWGDNDLVVTSLNWGAWSMGPDNPHSEIGVHLSGVGVARAFSERLKLLWIQL